MSEIRNYSDINSRLNLVVKNTGLDIQEFARSVNIERGQFGKVLKGTINITLKQLIEVSSQYKVRLGWLLEGEEPMYAHEKSGTNKAPDHHLLTQIEDYANGILVSLHELKKEHQDVFQPGTNVVPGSVQRAKTLDKKKTDKRPEGK